jgi:hypothetical protein
MNSYAILTNRKRTIIALIHSLVFALIAFASVLRAAQVAPIWLRDSSSNSATITLMIYLIVSSVLVQLVRVSRSFLEKLYFAFCASSAGVGLFRNLVGDHNLPAGRYFRLAMLLCAVLTGLIILRRHSRVLAVAENPN